MDPGLQYLCLGGQHHREPLQLSVAVPCLGAVLRQEGLVDSPLGALFRRWLSDQPLEETLFLRSAG